MFWRLTTVADDFGRFDANQRVLLSTCFPLKAGILKPEKIELWYRELEVCELVTTYVCNGKRLGFFNTWDKHQDRRAKKSKFPSPTSENICSQMRADVLVSVSEEPRNRGTVSEEPNVLPDWLDQDTWIKFQQHRKEIGHPMKPTQQRGLIDKLRKSRERGFDPNAMLEESIANGWRGTFEPKSQSANGNRPTKEDEIKEKTQRALLQGLEDDDHDPT